MAKKLRLKDINEVSNRLDKYLEAMHPDIQRKLAPHEVERLELMTKYRHWRLNWFSPENCRKMLMNEGGENKRSYSAACAIIEDSDWIFGKLATLNKAVERGVLYEYYHKALQEIIKDKQGLGIEKSNAMERVIDKMAKLVGAYDLSESMSPDALMPDTTYNIVVVNSKQ